MQDAIVTCGCTRKMALDPMRGKGAYRCGCGARVKIEEPAHDPSRCVGIVNGERCRRAPHAEGQVPLCKGCIIEVKVANGLIKPEDLDEYTDRLAAAKRRLDRPDIDKEEYVSYLQRVAEQKAAEETARWGDWDGVAKSPDGVVYYLAFGDRVKIGTTINLRQRLTSIPHDELLATEPGGYDLEARRHRQFAAHRITGEWFARDEELIVHINELRHRKYVSEQVPERRRQYLAFNPD